MRNPDRHEPDEPSPSAGSPLESRDQADAGAGAGSRPDRPSRAGSSGGGPVADGQAAEPGPRTGRSRPKAGDTGQGPSPEPTVPGSRRAGSALWDAGLALAVPLLPVSALLLVGGTALDRVAAVALAFLGGGLAVHVLRRDDVRRDRSAEIGPAVAPGGAAAEGAAGAGDEHERLRRQVERLEDEAWELREAVERQASILQALGDVVIRRDMAGSVLYVSPAASALFEPAVVPRPGQPLELPLAAPEGAELPVGDVVFGDIRLLTRQGPRWFSRLDVIVRDGKADQPQIQTLLRDVTDRRLMEEDLLAARHSAESASEAKSRFLATVSHEIRTPLNGILGMAALLRDTRLTPEQTAYADALQTSGETLLLLIDELLDFSRAEAGRLTLNPAPSQLAPLCEQVVELLAPRAQAKGLDIVLTLAPEVPAEVTVDASRLRQILFNLAGNGVKFTETGGVAVEIGIEPAPSGGTLVLDVADTGIGFAPDDAERLFGEFEQVDHGPARRYGGTGLGLAIVQRLVTLMQGSIAAHGAPGAGARFTVRLPVPEVPAVPRLWPELRHRRIAVVSSGAVEAAALVRQLEAHGAAVDRLQPGAARLTEALADADLVCLDHGSVSDGAAWLAGARAAGCRAPAVVFITPAERERLERLRAAGFAAYLIRPVRSQSLERTLTGLLRAPSDADAGVGQGLWEAGGSLRPAAGQGSSNPASAGKAGLEQGNTDRPSHRLAPARPLRLLLAEDNDINRLLGEALLRKLGHEAELVTNGHEAVAAASHSTYDAILMDLHMPGLDGFAAIEAIRTEERSTGRAPVPVIVVSADVMPAARDRALELGVLDYLTKPLSQAAVEQVLSRINLRF
ncbi:response regulator [Microvirga tunisiensis]|uniref:histidine kinase n=1 Tax=Pannonibacter tanglangensis TaxID=2750084 RepID=A0ABW9ZP60_9HYPH|nr:response regulator [Pannonibacter sp. XCT-34]